MRSVILATAGYDHTIRFWEAPGGVCYRTVQYPDSQINCLQITPDKSIIAAAGNSHVRLFEINSNNPNPVTSYDGHSGNITAVSFQKQGKWMYTAAEDGTVRIWDLRAPGCQRSFDCGAPVNTAVLHPNQVSWTLDANPAFSTKLTVVIKAEIYCGDQNGAVRVWDLAGNQCSKKMFLDGENAIRSISISADASYVAAANNQGNCFIWNPNSSDASTKKVFRAHDEYILKCQISPDTKCLATASSDRTVKIWDLATTTLSKTLQGHQRWVWDCAFSADSLYLVTASSDQSARLWDLSVGEVIRHYTGHHKAVTCVALDDSPGENTS